MRRPVESAQPNHHDHVRLACESPGHEGLRGAARGGAPRIRIMVVRAMPVTSWMRRGLTPAAHMASGAGKDVLVAVTGSGLQQVLG